MFKFVRSGRSLLQGGATSSEEPLLWRSLLKGGASSWEEPLVSILVSILYHFGNLGLHFSSFWKPWFPFQFILETLVSILDHFGTLVSILSHFGNLGFHSKSFWKPWFPLRGYHSSPRRGCGGSAEGCGGGAEVVPPPIVAQICILRNHGCSKCIFLH